MKPAGRTYQVAELARLAGVSVRALHHYDEIGLLVPSRRTRAGYRCYSQDDLLRLQQVLIGRELGMPLEQIKRSLDDPHFDRRAALVEQRAALAARAERATQMVRAIDAALSDLDGGRASELFEGFDPASYEAEARERFGQSEAYVESARRTAKYTKADWERYKAEANAIMRAAADLFMAGVASDDERARAVAEEHRASIDRWFYACSPDLHAGLADLYEADTRFAENIDRYAPGLTPWWSAAIRANQRGGTGR
ncbi:MAG: MerR family transcriptional regulator [Polyangiaceae bacterium]